MNVFSLQQANNLSAPRGEMEEEEEEEGFDDPRGRQLHMPPPMHPINIRSLMGMGQHAGDFQFDTQLLTVA
jgi:hypothetical protein